MQSQREHSQKLFLPPEAPVNYASLSRSPLGGLHANPPMDESSMDRDEFSVSSIIKRAKTRRLDALGMETTDQLERLADDASRCVRCNNFELIFVCGEPVKLKSHVCRLCLYFEQRENAREEKKTAVDGLAQARLWA